MICTDLRTHCYLEVITINRSSPRQDIFLTLGGVESQYSNARKNGLLFWVPSIVVTTPHSTVITARHIYNNICVNELRNEPEVEYTHLLTTEKA